jgi:hypothetical protein
MIDIILKTKRAQWCRFKEGNGGVILHPGNNSVKEDIWNEVKDGVWTEKLFKDGNLEYGVIKEKDSEEVNIDEIEDIEELNDLLDKAKSKKIKNEISKRIEELIDKE